MKSWNSFKDIGKDFYNGLGQRADKALDSPYDFANYITIGILDGVNSGAKDRYNQMFNSTEDFFNYATIGTTGMLKGAFSPEEQFSKEHWLNSFGVATSVLGIMGVTRAPQILQVAEV